MPQPAPSTICDELLAAALELARYGWQVFPLWGKTPAIPNPHPKGSWEHKNCHGECGRHGHGFYDATTDPVVITYWWMVRCPGANVAARVPPNMFVLDIDPQHGGHESLAALILDHGQLPETLTTISGRGTGGAHYFYRRPPGKVSTKLLGPGIDIKDNLGYTVHPPSCHPDSGKPYTYIDRPVVDPSQWLVKLITSEPVAPKPVSLFWASVWSPSVADDYCDNASWAEILEPHGWTCRDADPDADGAVWLHPSATSSCSATVRNGCLFVYSTNTPFEVTEPSNPHGYTRFRAFAILNHCGDLSAAARALREASS
jgi:hypothetical protein